MFCSYVMGIGEAEAFSERLKRELLALEAANVHAILESEPMIEEVAFLFYTWSDWIDDHFYFRLVNLVSLGSHLWAFGAS